ncbi:MAG: UDP-N-acetylmuramoyl-tripeptide--D-alanyl-D-alanine ligase [Bacteroidia bacterium]
MTIESIYSKYLGCSEICTDTRQISKDCLFFALKGENFNGNKFADDALSKGAKYVIVDEKEFATTPFHLLVDDVLTYLQELAKHHRQQLSIPIIGLTGSNGKTTTKELIHSVLKEKFKVFATKGNLNNHIGVPISILSIKKEHEMAIIEMGANHQKEIEFLCSISQPDFGVITNIGKAHLEGFGGEEGVKKGKKELYDYIKKNHKHIFINKSDEALNSISDGIHQIGYGKGTQINGEVIEGEEFLTFDLTVHHHSKRVKTHLIGNYNLPNALCAAAIGYEFGLSFEQICNGLENYQPDNNRSELRKTENNTLILDAYNANPSSMKAALDNFSKHTEDKLAILGDMFELGESSQVEHQEISDYAEKLGVKCIFVGKYFSETNTYSDTFENTQELVEYLEENPIKNTLVLIKGSRGMKLEQLIPLL